MTNRMSLLYHFVSKTEEFLELTSSSDLCMTWCHYGRKPRFAQDVTDWWNMPYFRKNCYAENEVLQLNAAKCWFGDGDHA